MAQTVVFLTDEPQRVSDPEWLHISIIYQLLSRVHPVVMDHRGSIVFVRSLIPQLASADERERLQLCDFFRLFMDAHERQCPALLVSLFAYLDGSRDLLNFPHFVVSFLSLLPLILHNSRAKANFQGQIPHLIRVLLTAPTLPFFQTQFVGFVTSNLIGIREYLEIVATLTQCWPVIFPLKQVAFLKILGILLARVATRLTNNSQSGLFQRVFRLIAQGSTSQSSIVAQCALSILLDSGLDMFVADHGRSLFPILYPAYMEASMSHWMPDVREAGKRALSFLSRIDPVMFKEAGTNCQPTNNVSYRKTWAVISGLAAERGHERACAGRRWN
jgi:hypothetical protein